MVKKKGLEEDIGNLSIEKRKLDKEKKSLESNVESLECRTTALDTRKKMLTQVNEEIRQQNNELYSENTRLTEANSSLAAENKSLAATSSKLSDDVARLQMRNLSNEADGDLKKYKADIARYFPDLEDLLNWGRYCTHIGFPDRFTPYLPKKRWDLPEPFSRRNTIRPFARKVRLPNWKETPKTNTVSS